MLHNSAKILGDALILLCLVSTVAGAQIPMLSNRPPRNMTCTKDDGRGNCTMAEGLNGKEVMVIGQGLKKGTRMTCVDTGDIVNCRKILSL